MPVVAPFGALMVALAAALIVWAIYTLFRPLLTSLAHNIPVIGGTLAQVIDSVIGWAWTWAKTGAETALKDLIGLVATPLHWIATLFDNLAGGLYDTFLVVSYLRYTVMPRLINQALSVAAGWDGGVQRYALALYHQGVDYTVAAVGALRSFTVSALSNLTQYAVALYHNAITYTDAAVTGAEHYSAALFNQAIAHTDAQASALEHYAQTLYTQSINYTGVQVTDLENWAKASLAGLQSWTGSEVLSLTNSIALSRAQAFAFTRTAVGEVEADLSKLKTECTDNLCSGLGGLASLFNLLGDLVDDVALIELAADFAHDPAGAADRMRGELGGLVDDGVGFLRDAVGI